jgi:molybdopterin-guanine dinucleotide biosynthesis protein A
VSEVVICGRPLRNMPSLPDRPAPDQGPLGGLNAALHHAALRRYRGVITIGCDMPLLEPGLLARLIGDETAVVKDHHLIGYWPATLAVALDHHLSISRDRSIKAWLATLAPRTIELHGTGLPNINTVEDLALLTKRWPAAD